jgi:hypothetical protein
MSFSRNIEDQSKIKSITFRYESLMDNGILQEFALRKSSLGSHIVFHLRSNPAGIELAQQFRPLERCKDFIEINGTTGLFFEKSLYPTKSSLDVINFLHENSALDDDTYKLLLVDAEYPISDEEVLATVIKLDEIDRTAAKLLAEEYAAKDYDSILFYFADHLQKQKQYDDAIEMLLSIPKETAYYFDSAIQKILEIISILLLLENNIHAAKKAALKIINHHQHVVFMLGKLFSMINCLQDAAEMYLAIPKDHEYYVQAQEKLMQMLQNKLTDHSYGKHILSPADIQFCREKIFEHSLETGDATFASHMFRDLCNLDISSNPIVITKPLDAQLLIMISRQIATQNTYIQQLESRLVALGETVHEAATSSSTTTPSFYTRGSPALYGAPQTTAPGLLAHPILSLDESEAPTP